MKKIIIGLVLFFLLSIPAMAADDEDDWDGRFGVNAGMLFFTNDALDGSSWFAGIEYAADMWSIELDYTTPDTITGNSDQFMMVHIDYLYYFNMDDYESSEIPTYVGVGYTHRFNGDAAGDGGGFNIMLGMDWDENWNFEAKYAYFDSDDSMWGIGVGWFFN